MRERQRGKTQEQAAVRANLRSRKTVAKYEQLGELPSAVRQPRTYRTRADPFAAVWPQVTALLERAPEVEARTLFAWLQEQDAGPFSDGQLRTLQRRVAGWRAAHRPPTLVLPQTHRPGEVLQTDGVWLSHLGITIAGERFPHVLIHSVLPYSNWEWGRVALSESFVAVQRGLQSALVELGAVPEIHQTDGTTAATHTLGRGESATPTGRALNADYAALLGHYGITGRTTHIASPNENGDVEAANGTLQRALEQHLLLRGTREFASVAAYEQWLFAIFRKRNAGRATHLAEEVAVMRPLRVTPLPETVRRTVRVSSAGLLRIHTRLYSVPSGLVGKLVSVETTDWEIRVWWAGTVWVTLPRLPRHAVQIDYHHVIDSLLRKPGGFRQYRFRDALFPRPIFAEAYVALTQRLADGPADRAYLRILKLAATEGEAAVTAALESVLAGTTAWTDATIAAAVRPVLATPPAIQIGAVDLTAYDALLLGDRGGPYAAR